MRYSVYNPTTGLYKIYEGNRAPFPTTRELIPYEQQNLGSSPKSIMPTLPPGSKYLGQSESPEGTIVKDVFSIGQFFMFVAAGVFARWLYERFFSK